MLDIFPTIHLYVSLFSYKICFGGLGTGSEGGGGVGEESDDVGSGTHTE